MKNIKLLLLSFSIIIGLVSHSQSDTTLIFRFNNYAVIPGATNDTLVFDLEIMSTIPGTYLVGFQSDVIFSVAAFGDSAQPVEWTRLAMVSSFWYNMPLPMSNPDTNVFRHGVNHFNTQYNPAYLSLVPTTTWGPLIQYKLLIVDNTFAAGIQLDLAAMTGNQFYITTIQFPPALVYDPVAADNDLLTFSLYPAAYDLFISEIADPSNAASGRFIEIYNADTEDIDFSAWPCYLITEFAGGASLNVEQLQGSVQSGETFVIAYDNDDFHSDYGFYPDQADNAIGLTGVDAVALYAFGDTTSGVLIDMYGEFGENGNSQPWYYGDRQAVRRFDIVAPNTVWTSSEWMIRGAEAIDMTPKSHRDTVTWTGATSTAWREKANWNPSYIPDAAHDVIINTIPGPIMQTGDTTACHDINF